MAEVKRPKAARPFWSGTLTFGLVSVPVELFTAVRSSRAALRMLTPRGHAVARHYVCPEHDRILDSDEIVRGLEIEPGRFVTVSDDELEQLQPELTREIDLRRFVDRHSIDPMYCDRPYFLLPQGDVTKPYRLLARVMEETGQAGVASFVMRGREHLVAIFADGGILRAETLRHDDEVRSADDVGLPQGEKADKGNVDRMVTALEDRAADGLEMEELRDIEAEALRALGEGKPKKQTVEVPEEADSSSEGQNVIDIMALLNDRLGARPSGATNDASNGEELSELSKSELYHRARQRDIPGRSKMSKDELVQALR